MRQMVKNKKGGFDPAKYVILSISKFHKQALFVSVVCLPTTCHDSSSLPAVRRVPHLKVGTSLDELPRHGATIPGKNGGGSCQIRRTLGPRATFRPKRLMTAPPGGATYQPACTGRLARLSRSGLPWSRQGLATTPARPTRLPRRPPSRTYWKPGAARQPQGPQEQKERQRHRQERRERLMVSKKASSVPAELT